MNYILNNKIVIIAIYIFYILQGNILLSVENNNQEDIYKINYKKIKLLEDYLNSIKNLTSDFRQLTNDNEYMQLTGKLYLKRPGKMRIEYHDELNKLLIIANKSILTYEDLELDEISYLRTNKTPISLMTRKNIKFDAKDIELVDFIEDDNSYYIILYKKNNKDSGKFTLEFNKNPIFFKSISIINDLEQENIIYLINQDFESKIDNNLFKIKNKNIPQ